MKIENCTFTVKYTQNFAMSVSLC